MAHKVKVGDTPLAMALDEELRSRGLRISELARDIGVPEPTLRNVYDGTTIVPNREMREALDDYFDARPSTTMRIIDGELDSYRASDVTRDLCRLARQLPDDVIADLFALMRTLVRSTDLAKPATLPADSGGVVPPEGFTG